jgi:hypothetical protein
MQVSQLPPVLSDHLWITGVHSIDQGVHQQGIIAATVHCTIQDFFEYPDHVLHMWFA